MNTESGEMRKVQDLSDEEIKSGKWRLAPEWLMRLTPKKRIRELKRVEYMDRVRARKSAGELK